MSKVTVTTFAKLNLILKVFRPEVPGGLHPIASLFQTVSLADQLYIEKSDLRALFLETNHPELQDSAHNLLSKIYDDFKAEIPFGLRVRLEKNIPIGGGLGGGSGNAAGFLAYLNQACQWGWSLEDLIRVGLRYGSDVPFFFMGGTALVQGVGEQLTEWHPAYQGYFVLANPGVHIGTPGVFRAFDRLGLGVPAYDPFVAWQESLFLGENDLAPVVFFEYPIYQELGTVLDGLAYDFYLSGSGATVLIPVANEKSAKLLLEMLSEALPTWWFSHVSTVPGPGYRLSIDSELY